MNIEDAVKHLHIPHELNEFIGDYYKALVKRADIDLLGESEFRCFARFWKCTQVAGISSPTKLCGAYSSSCIC